MLRARVNTQLRRGAHKASGVVRTGAFVFDFDRMDFRRDGVAVAMGTRWRTARTIWHLDDMLTAAMNGSFSEETFAESRLSSLES